MASRGLVMTRSRTATERSLVALTISWNCRFTLRPPKFRRRQSRPISLIMLLPVSGLRGSAVTDAASGDRAGSADAACLSDANALGLAGVGAHVDLVAWRNVATDQESGATWPSSRWSNPVSVGR